MSYSKVNFKNNTYKKHWNPVLKKWVESVINFTDKYDKEDFLCWYNERSSISSLAGAFWANNYYAIEEMKSTKSSKKKGNWSGRCDLWVACEDTEYWVEAKQVWVSASLNAPKTLTKSIKGLNNARKDAKAHLKGLKKKNAIGVVFISFRIPHSQIEQREELQNNLIKTLSGLEYDFMAVACPTSKKVTTEKGKTYLGCMLLGLSAKSAKIKS